MKEGIFPFTVIKPLIKPRRTPTLNVRNPIMNKFPLIPNSLTKMYELNAIMDPTDKSISPQIIKIPTPNAMMLNSGVKAIKS
jgi:hypothetical protein